MRTIYFIVILIVSNFCLAQNKLIGIVTEQNSGKKPVPNVLIKSVGANPITSTSKGDFVLTFQGLEAGKNIIIRAEKKGWEIVNEKELNTLIPVNPNEKPLKIILCPVGTLAVEKSKYYDTFEQKLYNKYTTLQTKYKDNQKELFRLEEEYARTKKQLNDLADEYSRINLDDVSEKEMEAIELFKAGKFEEFIALKKNMVTEEEVDKAIKLKGNVDSTIELYVKSQKDIISTQVWFLDASSADLSYKNLLNKFSNNASLFRDYAKFQLETLKNYKKANKFFNSINLGNFSLLEQIEIFSLISECYLNEGELLNALENINKSDSLIKIAQKAKYNFDKILILHEFKLNNKLNEIKILSARKDFNKINLILENLERDIFSIYIDLFTLNNENFENSEILDNIHLKVFNTYLEFIKATISGKIKLDLIKPKIENLISKLKQIKNLSKQSYGKYLLAEFYSDICRAAELKDEEERFLIESLKYLEFYEKNPIKYKLKKNELILKLNNSRIQKSYLNEVKISEAIQELDLILVEIINNLIESNALTVDLNLKNFYILNFEEKLNFLIKNVLPQIKFSDSIFDIQTYKILKELELIFTGLAQEFDRRIGNDNYTKSNLYALISSEIYELIFAERKKYIGEYFFKNKDYTKALKAYEEADQINKLMLKINPKIYLPFLEIDLMVNKGEVSFKLGEFSSTETYFSKAIEVSKKNLDNENSTIDTQNPVIIYKKNDSVSKIERIYSKLTLPLLFQGKYDEAEKIYIALKDKPYNKATYRETFLADLEELEKAGITHPDVVKIRELLKK